MSKTRLHFEVINHYSALARAWAGTPPGREKQGRALKLHSVYTFMEGAHFDLDEFDQINEHFKL